MRRNRWMAVAAAAVLMVAMTTADARRLGGGRSIGKQSPNVTQSQMAPRGAPDGAGAAAAPRASQAAPSARQPAAAGAAAQSPARSRWLAPLAGIAAGLGLAALASHLGFGEELASMMMLGLIFIAALMAFRFFRSRSRSAQAPTGARGSPLRPAYSYNGVGQEASVTGYSAPPGGHGGAERSGFERAAVSPDFASRGASAGAQAGAEQFSQAESQWRVPADFDVETFLRQAKSRYVELQKAFDAGDLTELREFTTAEMYEQLRQDIAERGGAANRTDVVTLDAELLGIATDQDEHLASVHFHGMVREAAGAAAESFDEVWNLSKPLDGSSGWVLAGVQVLS